MIFAVIIDCSLIQVTVLGKSRQRARDETRLDTFSAPVYINIQRIVLK